MAKESTGTQISLSRSINKSSYFIARGECYNYRWELVPESWSESWLSCDWNVRSLRDFWRSEGEDASEDEEGCFSLVSVTSCLQSVGLGAWTPSGADLSRVLMGRVSVSVTWIVVSSAWGLDCSGEELIKDWLDKGFVKRLKDCLKNRTEEDRLGDLLGGPRLTTVWDLGDLKDRLERTERLGENVESLALFESNSIGSVGACRICEFLLWNVGENGLM